MAIRNKNPVTTDASPVLAPAPTPAELSTKVVVVEVPKTAPAVVAIASASNACLILGSFSFSSSMSAFVATPTSVPIVSNISTNRKERMITIKSAIGIAVKFKCAKIGAMLGTESPLLKSGSRL